MPLCLTLCIIAFAVKDRRLRSVSYPIGFLFACFAVFGLPMNTARALPGCSWLVAGQTILTVAVFTLVFGAAVLLLYRGALRLIRRGADKPALARPESRFSRLLGNGFFTFALVLACWVPVWLAFYPGIFQYDADTQFYSYMDGMITAQHPVLHTLLLGWLLDIGNGADSLTLGVALYSAVQMTLMAGILGYACSWLRRRRVPLGLRIAVLVLFALLPLYALWSFSATKDVLFGGLVLLTCLQMTDLWEDGVLWMRKPLRVIGFVLTAALMMLMRNNGVYAFVLAFPFAVIAAKSRRVRTAVLLTVCVGAYIAGNTLLVSAVDAGPGCSYVEAISVPLQQVARSAAHGQIGEEDTALLEELFTSDIGGLYQPTCSDNVKWNLDEEVLTENLGDYAALWLRVGMQNPQLYLESFLEQNLPYYYPGSTKQYNIVLGLLPMDMYTLEEAPVLPALRPFYEAYDRTFRLFNVPGTELLADTACMVWLLFLLLGLAIYRRQQGMTIAGLFLLALWGTCLLGSIAAMRYLLGLFYALPVLAAAVFAKEKSAEATKP